MAGDSGAKPIRRRGPGRPFQKGQSGNPSGMPKGLAEFRKKIACLDDDAFLALQRCINDEDGRVAVAALKEFFDRRYGKASQPITGEDGKPLRLDVSIVDVVRKLAAGE